MRSTWHRMVGAAFAIATAQACAQAAQAELGKGLFEQCAACHTVDGGDSVGPTLLGIAGRKAGSVEGFRYSRALRTSNVIWDAASLDAFLADPQQAVPGNVIPYSGMTDPRQRVAVIAYLLSFSPNASP